MTLTFTFDGTHVIATTGHGPLTLGRDACNLLLRLWAAEHDDLLRSGIDYDRTHSRKIRDQIRDLDLARPLEWVSDNQVLAYHDATPEPTNIVRLEPLRCVVRTLDHAWAVVPGPEAA